MIQRVLHLERTPKLENGESGDLTAAKIVPNDSKWAWQEVLHARGLAWSLGMQKIQCNDAESFSEDVWEDQSKNTKNWKWA